MFPRAFLEFWSLFGIWDLDFGICLFSFEVGRSLLQESLGPFIFIFAAEANPLALAFQVQPSPEGHAQPFIDRLLGHLDGHRPLGHDLLQQLFRLFHGLPFGNHPLDQADPQGLLGVDPLIGEDDLFGLARADQAGKTLGSPITRE